MEAELTQFVRDFEAAEDATQESRKLAERLAQDTELLHQQYEDRERRHRAGHADPLTGASNQCRLSLQSLCFHCVVLPLVLVFSVGVSLPATLPWGHRGPARPVRRHSP